MSYAFRVAATDPDGGQVCVRLDWGDGRVSVWSRFVPGGTEVTFTHAWDSAGSYSVKAQAKDEQNAESDWSAALGVAIAVAAQNQPPGNPTVPSGPTACLPDSSYDYTVSAVDPDTDSVALRIVWGNGDTSAWSSLVPSGTSVTLSHAWDSTGSYRIRAQAKDTKDALSGWSDSLAITVALGNRSPDRPQRPRGPSSGQVGVTYRCTTYVSDPDGDSVACQVRWGDGDSSAWSGFVPSGTNLGFQHMWDSAGVFRIIARAKDAKNALSGWSDTLTVAVAAGNRPPDRPQRPRGPSSGQVGVTYRCTTHVSDPDGDSVACQVKWGDGDSSAWGGFVPSGTNLGFQHMWDSAGVFRIIARAKDAKNALSGWSDTLTVTIAPANQPPNAPSTPSGPSAVLVGETCYYSVAATDPDNDSVAFQFDWGDGQQSQWTSYVPSGDSAVASHTWSSHGPYYVMARAKDDTGAMSGWSDSMLVMSCLPAETWFQQVHIDQGTGQTVFIDSNPNGRSAALGGTYRLSNYPEYGGYTWELPPDSSRVQYYHIDLSGCYGADSARAYWTCRDGHGGTATFYVSINGGSAGTCNNPDTMHWFGWTAWYVEGMLNWNSADNFIEIANLSQSSSSLLVLDISLRVYGVWRPSPGDRRPHLVPAMAPRGSVRATPVPRMN